MNVYEVITVVTAAAAAAAAELLGSTSQTLHFAFGEGIGSLPEIRVIIKTFIHIYSCVSNRSTDHVNI